jgi:hypothetical protein
VKLVGRIPVEPLDDERMTNIERRIVAGAADAAARGEVRARWSPMLAVAVIAVAVMGAGAIGWKLHGERAAPVVAEAAPLEVHTDEQRSRLDIGDARIDSATATAFKVTRPDGGVLITMARGKVELEVGKRGDRPALVVRAGETDVVVVGTRFSVDYGDGTGEVDVRVTEGVVRVVHHQQETRVAAGEAWTAKRGLIALADAGGGATIAGAESRGSGNVEIDMGQAPDVLHERVAVVPNVRVPGGSSSVRPKPAGNGQSVKRSLDQPGDPYVDLKSAIRAQLVAPALVVDAENPATAVSAYREIAALKKGDEASHAFYSIAVVQHLKLGRDTDALTTLDAYMRRFAGGKEYAAALWLRVRISCLRGIDDRCRQAAYTYLRSATEGTPAAAIAERLTISP